MSYLIEGGNDRLPKEFSKRVDVRYRAPIVEVKQDDRGVDVSIQRTDGIETLRADRIVCAIPCPVIGRIFRDARLSDAKQRAIREQNYSRTVKVFLQTRTRFWLKDGLSGNVTTDLPIERLTPDPGADPGARGALAAYPIGAYTSTLESMSEDDRVAAALKQAQQVFPELSKAFEGGIAHCWGLDQWQRGSFALHTPGQIGFIETLAKPEGRIHFCGRACVGMDGMDARSSRVRPARRSRNQRIGLASATGLLVRRSAEIETLLGAVPERYDFGDFERVDGVMVPKKIVWSRADCKVTFAVSTIRQEANR
jgi:monoamine oxidase